MSLRAALSATGLESCHLLSQLILELPGQILPVEVEEGSLERPEEVEGGPESGLANAMKSAGCSNFLEVGTKENAGGTEPSGRGRTEIAKICDKDGARHTGLPWCRGVRRGCRTCSRIQG